MSIFYWSRFLKIFAAFLKIFFPFSAFISLIGQLKSRQETGEREGKDNMQQRVTGGIEPVPAAAPALVNEPPDAPDQNFFNDHLPIATGFQSVGAPLITTQYNNIYMII